MGIIDGILFGLGFFFVKVVLPVLLLLGIIFLIVGIVVAVWVVREVMGWIFR